ncbi:PLDc N-terminal domain-containing protein [Robertkochia solimangrovi]|uniref:PLDc N-terminal domain-containing protein n=1 Tax=Robertkochia solimangrovi TaxID=2213046 RepID=UPI00117E092E|nr:PLDc N-terminal domain-containing protein [Robertkochia solimangrovi]TRZ43201.1 hypothetical protein DMZ48_10950 [Robertkochia solimangrovi]
MISTAFGLWQLTLFIIAIITIVFVVAALIDILKSEFPGNNKTVWILVVVFFGIFGAILYFGVGTSQKTTHR